MRAEFSCLPVLVVSAMLRAIAIHAAPTANHTAPTSVDLLVLGGTCAMLVAIFFPVSSKSNLPVTVVCKLEKFDYVWRLFDRQSLLVAFNKPPASDLIEFTVQVRLAPCQRDALLQRVLASPYVLKACIAAA